jgi:hypothetical protein
MKTQLGGNRLGSGGKLENIVHYVGYSNHDIGSTWRSTMSAGTLVPFMNKLALPGDSLKINLDVDVMTHPTVSALFGSYKVQLDVFSIPIRLYNKVLVQNKMNIGMDMAQVKLPQMLVRGNYLDFTKPLENQQVNTSSILSYLGIRGIGTPRVPNEDYEDMKVSRYFNAVPLLMYWDIYKQYYANVQEEEGALIHNPSFWAVTIVEGQLRQTDGDIYPIYMNDAGPNSTSYGSINRLEVRFNTTTNFDYRKLLLNVYNNDNTEFLGRKYISEIFEGVYYDEDSKELFCERITPYQFPTNIRLGNELFYNVEFNDGSSSIGQYPTIKRFPLKNIDDMKDFVLNNTGLGETVVINDFLQSPYKDIFEGSNQMTNHWRFSIASTQEGLGLKTYQSDMYNNWMNAEWIDGDNGINTITDVNIVDNKLSLNELALNKKLWEMLNRIAVTGGRFDDWVQAIYDEKRDGGVSSPMYIGGLSKELVFQEVISNNTGSDQPLGTIGGRGIMANKKKGGYVSVSVDEPSYIMGIISITPRIDYSQGNEWDTNLENFDEFHKPDLDAIAFQELSTDRMAFWETQIDTTGGDETTSRPIFRSAGKQPSWLHYMTDVNKCYGNFAVQDNQMFMTLNRRYDWRTDEDKHFFIKDLTTYIDPSKFNYIFADTSLDAQNFWTQIKVDIFARRKMSSKQMPNL